MSGAVLETEIGSIPADWRLATGEEITSLITKGASPRWQGFSYGNSGMLFVTSENVRDGFLDLSRPKFLPMEFHEKISRSAITKGDILVNLVGASIGRSCLVRHDIGVANINQAVAVFRPNALVDPDFIAFAFQHPETIQRILGMQVEAARPNISLGDLRGFKLPLPPLHEQQAIAAALSDADGVVAGLERVIAKKRLIKQGAMQDLLTARRRLPGFSGEWEVKRLGDHVRFLKNGTHSRAQLSDNGPVKNLHYGDIHGASSIFLAPATSPMPTLEVETAGRLDRLTTGDLVFVDASEDLVGVGTSVEITDVNATEVVSGLHTIAARFDKSVLVDGFKAFLQFMPDFRSHLCQLAAGTKVLATNRGHIASADIPLPQPSEQEAIAAVLSDMDAEIQTLESRLTKARAVKEGMMQNLLTGRVRLV